MNFINLGSSSSGNCYYLELDRKDNLPPVKIMLEVGFPYKDILKKCINEGIEFNEIDAFLVTHGHKDHSCAMNDLVSRGKRVYANYKLSNGNLKTTLRNDIQTYVAPDVRVISFNVMHDADDPLGFIISTGVETILFVNDCKYFGYDLSLIKFDYVFIEANYDGTTLHYAYEEAKRSNDPSNTKRYERIFNSHMSLKNCIEHLKKLNLTNCKAVFLMHLSDRHANENQFKKRVQDEIGVKTFVCKKNGGII